MLSFEFATKTHEKLLFDWANDPETRKNSYTTEDISWKNHVKWYHKRLNDPGCRIYIFKLDDNFCGMARIEKSGDELVIGINVAPDYRGKGLATEIIERSSIDYIERMNVSSITAYIKLDNHASQKAFERAGYKEMGLVNMHGSLSKKYSYGIQ